MTLDDLPLALYDERGEKIRGGFHTAADALAWYNEHPIYDLFDEDGEWRAEAFSTQELVLFSSKSGGDGSWTIKLRDISRFDVYPEVI